MAITEIYKCEPCNYEMKRVNFGTSHDALWKAPDCPLCSGELEFSKPKESMSYYTYICWKSEGGCGSETEVQFPENAQPEEFACVNCEKMAKIKMQAPSLMHSGSSTKGASVDVIIGRDSERRWEKIHERTDARNKIRKEAGTAALTATDRNEYKPIVGGQLTAVTVPKNTVNRDEKD